jgi:hypothetical protein
VVFKKEPKRMFSFTKQWAYPWYILKDEHGKFTKGEQGEITEKDTSHLYFTANCKTSVQGGYNVRYCDASKNGERITLSFLDAAAAYTSGFYIVLAKNKFIFEPKIIYPVYIRGEKTTCKITRRKLVLYQENYRTSKMISGYVNVEFIETVRVNKNKPVSHKHYFRGYFKTAVN